MKKSKKKIDMYSIGYGIALLGFTLYVLLKTFVIPSAIQKDVQLAGVYASTEETEMADTTEVSEQEAENIAKGYPANASVSDYSYEDDNISITLTKERISDTDVYFADIQISNVSYFKTAFAENTYGRNIIENTSDIADEHNAILAINGDFYGFRDYGYVIRNGALYRSNFGEGVEKSFVVYEDGSSDIITVGEISAEELLANGAVQVLSFGPSLLEDGIVVVDESDPNDTATIAGRNPRTAIGVIDTLHYVFVVADGRTKDSPGYTFYELANVMLDYGCVDAYNLDGGGSSTLYFNGEVINNPTNGTSIGEREVSDIVYIGY